MAFNLNNMLGKAASKLGVSTDDLKSGIDSGNLQSIFKNMSPEDSAKIQEVINNPEAAKHILATPEAQELLKQIKK